MPAVKQRIAKREARTAPEHPQTVTHVLNESFEEIHAAGVAARFFYLIDAAEFQTRAAGRFLMRQPRLHRLLDLSLDVGAQFFVQFRFH